MNKPCLGLFFTALLASACAVDGASGDVDARDSVADEGDLGRTSAALGTPADLAISLTAPSSGVGGARGAFRLVVRNVGGSPATASKVLLTMPAPMSFYSASPWFCNYGPTIGTIACDFGTLQPNTSITTNLTVALPITPSTTLSGAATTTAVEASTSNNTATVTAALAPPPAPVAIPIALAAPRNVRSTACSGVIPSFAGCTPGSFIVNNWVFLPSGSFTRNNVRMGVWSQPNGPESLRMEFQNAQGTVMGHYDATGASASCFEGFSFAGAQSTSYSGAIQICLQ